MNLILASIGVFLGIILLLVVILLVAKQYLTPSGKVKITINGEKELEVEQGSTLLNTLSVNGIKPTVMKVIPRPFKGAGTSE